MGKWAQVVAIPFVGTVGGNLMVTGLAFEATRRGATTFELGLMTATFQSFRALGAPLFGALSDRARSRKPFIVAGTLGIMAAVVPALLLPGISGLVIARAVQGISSGFLWPGMQTVVTETSVNASTALSTYFALGELGRSAGLAIYSRGLAHRFTLTLVVALLALAFTLVLILVSVPSGRVNGSRGSVVPVRWRDGAPIFLAAAFSGGVVGLSNEVMLGYLGIYRGLGESGAAFTLLWANLFALAVMFGIARVAERGSYSTATLLAFFAMGSGALTLPHFSASFLKVSLIALLGGAYSFTPLSRLLAGRIMPERLGTGIGLMNMSANAGGVFIPPALGGLIAFQFAGHSPLDPWILLGAVSLMSGLYLAFGVIPRLDHLGGESG
jgi:DHA1 family multidrug resistance protein-like MFS transporter